ncbi:hypothetical protein BC832DRAFT_548325 [Gaertneriomyces semiglobifer]|nr:hypothetical protein BC832DRAFT_548325 [Gaertneriomyces semiglobifer]
MVHSLRSFTMNTRTRKSVEARKHRSRPVDKVQLITQRIARVSPGQPTVGCGQTSEFKVVILYSCETRMNKTHQPSSASRLASHTSTDDALRFDSANSEGGIIVNNLFSSRRICSATTHGDQVLRAKRSHSRLFRSRTGIIFVVSSFPCAVSNWALAVANSYLMQNICRSYYSPVKRSSGIRRRST